MSEDPLKFGGSDLNFYRYVQNKAIVANDPSGLATYSCSYPIFGGLGSHSYLCVDDLCDGQGPASGSKFLGWYPQEGVGNSGPTPSEGGSCTKETGKQNEQCVDSCVLAELIKPKPEYNIWTGSTCHNYSNNILKKCKKKCK